MGILRRFSETPRGHSAMKNDVVFQMKDSCECDDLAC